MAEATTPYRSLRPIARGGMARVDVAIRREGSHERLYALKRLRAEYRHDARCREMFVEEARLAGMLRHPHIVSVLDTGTDEEGAFLVMELVNGVSLSTMLRTAASESMTLPVQLCVRVMREVALGLSAAHELVDADGAPLGLIHRDVSPQNILLGFDGVTRLTDFGIAKAYGSTTNTTTGVLKGKVSYMSPEQLQFREPDQRSDLFSFGVVLFEMLAGERLYAAREVTGAAQKILSGPVPDIDDHRDDVPPPLVELLFSLLAKDPELRPASAAAVARRLDAILAELEQDEPPIELSSFLQERFARIAARQALELRELLHAVSGREITVQTPQPRDAARSPLPLHRASLAAVALASLAIAGLVLAATLGAGGASTDPSIRAADPPTPPPTAHAVTEETPEPVATEDADARRAAVVTTAPTDAPPTVDASASSRRAARPTTARTRRRHGPRGAPMEAAPMQAPDMRYMEWR